MSSTALTIICPSCKKREAHEIRQFADPAARKPAEEYVLCRGCGHDSRASKPKTNEA